MSVVLFIVGAITLLIGTTTIGFGIPINEFSFGNTLIVAGTTAAVGGLIVVGLGAVVSQLQRLGDIVATRAPQRAARPAEAFEAPPAPPARPARTPFPPPPPAPKPEAELPEPATIESPVTAPMPAAVALAEAPVVPSEAPLLQNPAAEAEAAEAAEAEAAAAAAGQAERATGAAAPPPPPAAPPIETEAPARRPFFGFGGAKARAEPPEEPSLEEAPPAWLAARRPAAPEPAPASQLPPLPQEPETRFEALWPAEPAEPPRAQEAAPYEREEQELPPPEAPAPQPAAEPTIHERREVAILKSGVVDGMAYTLYVDGSIEAELPQGTLHFASINELREHLEKNA